MSEHVDLAAMNPEVLLTVRQAEILRAHRRGLSNAEIGRKFGITGQAAGAALTFMGKRIPHLAPFPTMRERRHADAFIVYAKAIREQL